ncbi:hypothetical protein [Burkholderia pyrrocinia]
MTNVLPAGGTFFLRRAITRAAARDRTRSTSHANICSTLGERDGPYTGSRTIAQVDILGIASVGRVISISKSIRCPLRAISLI